MEEQNDNMSDGADPAQRAASIVAEHVNSVIDASERQAHEVLRDAERDAEATRREALESARRVFERIDELERPLREFVQNLQLETDRVGRELAGHVDAEATTIPSGSGSAKAVLSGGGGNAGAAPAETVVADPVDDKVAEPGEEPVAKRADEPTGKLGKAPLDESVKGPGDEQVAKGPIAKEPGATTVSPTVESGPAKLASRLLGRLRDGDASKGAFITAEGHCSVCQKGFMAGSAEQLEQSDWTVNGDVGLCPECRGDGWQLPEGARLPFRRGGG